jgi:transcriptional regulator with GAF, ATPase, and Fis domain
MNLEELNKIKKKFEIVGNSKLLNRAIELATIVAPTDLSVLIRGENGSGKESFAKIIHSNSLRNKNNFVSINCAAISGGTIDSELFGHKKGSFTGAIEDRKGYFQEAEGGTIFLDEIGDLPLSFQTKLLRAIEQKEILKVGSSKIEKINVRIVAATNVDLVESMRIGKFREDLFFRLNTIPINIPPLRDRKEDILIIFLKFASDFAIQYKKKVIELSEEAKNEILNYDFPGNIRELKNIVEYLSLTKQESIVGKEDVQSCFQKRKSSVPVVDNFEENEKKLLYKIILQLKKEVGILKSFYKEILKKKIIEDKDNLEEFENFLKNESKKNNNLEKDIKFLDR